MNKNDPSWLIQAIERAAMQRARSELRETDTVRVFGLTLDVVRWLIDDYEHKTKLRAAEIDWRLPHLPAKALDPKS